LDGIWNPHPFHAGTDADIVGLSSEAIGLLLDYPTVSEEGDYKPRSGSYDDEGDH
jgi:hypothetical protein